MQNKTIVVAIILFVLIIVGMFIFAYLKKNEIVEEPATAIDDDTDVTPDPYAGIERIEAKHFFRDDTHTVVGEIPMPTPCDLLEWDVFIAESFPEQVTIDFRVINNADACAQVVTPQRFKAEFGASEKASIRARLMGRELELNLIPGAEGETPDDFEIFIKG